MAPDSLHSLGLLRQPRPELLDLAPVLRLGGERLGLVGQLAPLGAAGESGELGHEGHGLQRHPYDLRRNTSRLSESTRSRNRTPSRWSTSCRRQRASNPEVPIHRRSPARSMASSTTSVAR